ncbi:unnamed protein product [Didymodactylos carnosus]|uniref:Recombinase A n=1 Tax=Didymodactylos carnosus TaxID=1234261 RepID=A0A8S2D4U0_9BILA|nr:unnamed protein product [Didymodactylos carnosus]CAF3588663.1 unnamed protein product [Didymodactylos carnosus]
MSKSRSKLIVANYPSMENKMESVSVIEQAIKDIQRQFGKGALLRLEGEAIESVPVISTGSVNLNAAIGVGGYPKGRITEIFGPESAGKTTLALHAVLECQKAGGRAAFIDAEHALDVKYARSLGIKLDELLVSQPQSGEQALQIVEALAKTEAIDLVVVDSVAALVPQAELDGEIGDVQIGGHARLMSKSLRILNGSISRSQMALVFINQLREKVGIIFGNPEITTGGRSLKFYASLRLEVRKDSLIKDGAETLGLKSKVTVVKNKLASPFGIAYVNIYFGKGFDYSSEIIDFGITYGIIEKAGTWYSYRETRLGQGKMQVRRFFDENPVLYRDIEHDVLARVASPAPAS